MISDRMSACSSGGLLVSVSSGLRIVPPTCTRASTPEMSRVAEMSSVGLTGMKPSNRTRPSRSMSNRRPWNSYVPRTVFTWPTKRIGRAWRLLTRRSPPSVTLRLPSPIGVFPGWMSLPLTTRSSGTFTVRSSTAASKILPDASA